MAASSSKSIVYLVPALLSEQATETIPSYIVNAVKDCQVFFVENERSARRYLKSIWKEIIIDNYTWVNIDKAEDEVKSQFKNFLKEGKNIGIISEAGCPGIADPGQVLVNAAHETEAQVKPLVGPSSIIMAMMASGMNGQQFQFVGYLPIETQQRVIAIKELESESARKKCTQVFIETPYRNNQLLETLVKTCKGNTRLCIATDITSMNEYIHTKSINEWKLGLPDLHKRPTIFCLLAT